MEISMEKNLRCARCPKQIAPGEPRTKIGRFTYCEYCADEKLKIEPEVTKADIDKAIASIPRPMTFADYGRTWKVLPGGGVEEIIPEKKYD
jgi:hypothetical protein